MICGPRLSRQPRTRSRPQPTPTRPARATSRPCCPARPKSSGSEALAESVCQYNDRIADYALNLPGLNLTGSAVVGLLIGPPREEGHPLTSGDGGGAGPPAKAPPREESPPDKAPPREESPLPTCPAGGAEPALSPPSKSQERRSNRPISEAGPSQPATAYARYSGLVDTSPGFQARELASTLHWDRLLPEQAGEPVTLEDCLYGGAASDRQAILDAYWVARQRAAEYQVLAEQVEMLEELRPGMAASRAESTAGQTPPALRAAQAAASAAVLEARISLLAAQFELAERSGRQSARFGRCPARRRMPASIC